MEAFVLANLHHIVAPPLEPHHNSPPPLNVENASPPRVDEVDQSRSDQTQRIDPPEGFVATPVLIVPQPTLEKLIEEINKHGRIQGYAIRILNTTKRDGKMRAAYLGCTLAGQHHDSHAYIKTVGRIRSKHPRSKRTGCLFKLYASTNEQGLWNYTARHLVHNHEPDDSPRIHHQHRKPTTIESEKMIDAFNAGVSASKILELLCQAAARENRPTYVSMREIYNAKTRYFSYGNQGRTFTDELLLQLEEAGFDVIHKVGDLGELTDLIMTEPMAMALMRHYGYVLYIDCTYKTNMYRLPLLNIVATTGCNTSFTVAFAFMHREREEDYIWAMESFKKLMRGNVPTQTILTDNEKGLRNAITRIFPDWNQLLCIWHINKNIVAKCKRGLPEETFNAMLSMWTSVVQAPTEVEYLSLLRAFIHAYDATETSPACTYMVSLLEDKRFFARHLTDRMFHLNNIATSIAESSHAAIKRSLNGTRGNLFQTTKNILRHMSATQAKIFLEHATENRAKLLYMPEIFALVSLNVAIQTSHAEMLDMIARFGERSRDEQF